MFFQIAPVTHEQSSRKKIISHPGFIKIANRFLFRSKSFQSKPAARAPLLIAAILFFHVHEHQELILVIISDWLTCHLDKISPKSQPFPRGDMSLQHIPGTCTPNIFMCAQMLWFCPLLHVPTTRPCYMSLQSVLHKFFGSVAALVGL